MPRAFKPARLWLRPATKSRNATWLVLDGGKQIATGCGPEERHEAEKFLNRHLQGKHDPRAPTNAALDEISLAGVLLIYHDDVSVKAANPTKAKGRILRLADWWGDKSLADITPKTCEAYVKARGSAMRPERLKRDGTPYKAVKQGGAQSVGGSRRDLEDLRAAVAHHAKLGLHTGSVRVTLPAKGRPRSKYLTRDEVAAMLWYCWRHKRGQMPWRGARAGKRIASADFYDMRHIARFILMGIYTGSRSGPILRASIYRGKGRAFLDLDAGIYHRLPEDMDEASNKKSPTVPIAPRLLAHLRRWRDRSSIAQYVVEWDGKPVASIKTAWARVIAEARIGGKPDGARIEGNPTPHTLRHTRVTWLKQDGVSSWHVGGYVGMSEAMVERVYGHHDPNFMAEVITSIGKRPARRPNRATDNVSPTIPREQNATNAVKRAEAPLK